MTTVSILNAFRSFNRSLLAALLALTAALSMGAQAQEIEIISLRHRSAEELLPLLRPLVEPGGALTGQGYQLFLRSSRANANQLKQMLAALDRAPRQLLITVRQDRDDEDSERSLSANGSVTIDSRRRGAVDIDGRVNAHQGRSTATRAATQSVRVSEGGRASIAIGSAVPFTFKQYVVSPSGVTQFTGSTYYEAVTGFFVQPRLSGEQVTLEIAPQDTQLSGQGVQQAQLSTTVQGRLGEWIAVGGSEVAGASQSQGLGYDGQRNTSQQRGVWLKVEELP